MESSTFFAERGLNTGARVQEALNVSPRAAEFWYTERLRGEPAEGVNDLHVHPIEPRTVRFTVGKSL
jgi:hypothetical protein